MHGLRNITTTSPDETRANESNALLPGNAPVPSWIVMLLLTAIVGLTVLAYSPVLFDFFCGDDFVHLSWLSQAVNHPEMLLRNFHSSWLDGTTTKFYRPLISVFMYTDYIVGGPHGLAFHLTNLGFHLLSTVSLFFIVQQMGMDFVQEHKNESPAKVHTRAFIAAAIFGLYPLHPEAVSWITGRVDSVVTAFCLGAMWCYMRWRAKPRIGLLLLTLLACILGLLSKEMAITLPAVFLCREIFLSRVVPAGSAKGTTHSTSTVNRFAQWIYSVLAPTLPFWGLLAVYFVVRWLSLGTFVGGYDDSLFFIANLREFLLSWLHALRMFVEPVNRTLISTRDPLTRSWDICLAVTALFGIGGMVVSPACRRQLLFTLSWLGLSLIPVYKIFAISDDLQGSRLAYLATAPLCVLFAFACVSWQRAPLARGLGAALGCILAGLCFVLLGTNNQPWIASGRQANAIRSGLAELYSHVPGDPQALFIGLPDQINGAYTCRNSLDGMTKRPQLSRDITNCLMVNPFEPIFPFGYLKDSIAAERKAIRIFRWNSPEGRFLQVPIPESGSIRSWSIEAPSAVVGSVPEHPAEIVTNADGSVRLSTTSRAGEVEVSTGQRNCWSTDFVQAEIVLHDSPTSSRAGAELLYSNDLVSGFELRRRAHADFDTTGKNQVLTFALRGLPEWSFGGDFRKFKFLLPPHTSLTLTKISAPDRASIMPAISFENSGYLGSKGYLHLGASSAERTLRVDCSRIERACSSELEITRANLLFEEQNSRLESAVQWRKVPIKSATGTAVLRYAEFPRPGIYEVRARALGKDGKLVGVSSDHIVISVDAK